MQFPSSCNDLHSATCNSPHTCNLYKKFFPSSILPSSSIRWFLNQYPVLYIFHSALDRREQLWWEDQHWPHPSLLKELFCRNQSITLHHQLGYHESILLHPYWRDCEITS